MEKEELYVIEDYVERLETQLTILRDQLTLLDVKDSRREVIVKSMNLLQGKVEAIKNAKNKKELKKHLKVKKLLGDKLV